jgi:hypothetical protein
VQIVVLRTMVHLNVSAIQAGKVDAVAREVETRDKAQP